MKSINLFNRIISVILIIVMISSLIGCGGNSTGTIPQSITPNPDITPTPSSTTIPTTQISGSVKTSEIGGTNLVIKSVHQENDSYVNNGVFITTVSSKGTQLLFVVEPDTNKIRGFTLSTVNSSSGQVDIINVDATSTALSLLFLTPGITTINPTETQSRIAELKRYGSFYKLVNFLRANLPSKSLSDLVTQQDYNNLFLSVISEWISNHPLLKSNDQLLLSLANTKDFTITTNHGGVVDVSLPQDDTSVDLTKVKFTLTNHGFRYVNVYRRDLYTNGTERANRVFIPLLGPIEGAKPLGWGSGLFGTAGNPKISYNEVNFSSIYSSEYYFIGPGISANSDTLPSSISDISGDSIDAWELTFIFYAIFPFMEIILGTELRDLLPEDIQAIWKDITNIVSIEKYVENILKGDLTGSAAALFDILVKSIKFIVTKPDLCVKIGLTAGAAAIIKSFLDSGSVAMGAVNLMIVGMDNFTTPHVLKTVVKYSGNAITPTPTLTPTPTPTLAITTVLPIPSPTLTPTPTPDGNKYVYVNNWGSNGTGDGQFNFPNGITLDASENVYMADTNNNRIQKFNSNGGFITKWGSNGTGDGQFNFPLDISSDASGNIYVADTNNNRIQKFNSSGGFITKWGSNGTGDGQFNFPNGITLDASENVYVVDSNNNRIQKFNSSGGFITKWGSNGTGDGQFNIAFNPFQNGIAVDASDNVYVIDFANYRIQKFNSSGGFITKWGSNGTGDGQFMVPSGIAVDIFGNVYVGDVQHSVEPQKFTSNGVFIPTQWFGSVNPSSIVINSSGSVYIVDRANDKVTFFIPQP